MQCELRDAARFTRRHVLSALHACAVAKPRTAPVVMTLRAQAQAQGLSEELTRGGAAKTSGFRHERVLRSIARKKMPPVQPNAGPSVPCPIPSHRDAGILEWPAGWLAPPPPPPYEQFVCSAQHRAHPRYS